MKLRIASWPYGVRIAPGPIMYDGRERMGLCKEVSRELLISPNCPPQSRLAVLLHEYFHAWLFHCGHPSTVEDQCDLFATAAASLIDGLSMNGGKEALLRLQPGESPQPGAARILLTRNRYCAKCEATIAGGSVTCVQSGTGILPVLKLSLYCEGCNHTQRWTETATIGGAPSGMIVGEPKFEHGMLLQRPWNGGKPWRREKASRFRNEPGDELAQINESADKAEK